MPVAGPRPVPEPGPRNGLAGGLTEAEVADRRRRGLANDVPDTTSRSIGQIVRANVVTYFNFVLGTLAVLILIYGEGNDALFGGVLVANTAIGIVQQVRAKRALDRLALLTNPRARVRRDTVEREVAVRDVVLDDLVVLSPGDQIVVDGEVVHSTALEIDESLLTGESDPAAKDVGDDVLSGAFVAAGSGIMAATKVGKAAYASQIAVEARKFTMSKSELQQSVDKIIRWASYAMIPAAIVLAISQAHRLHHFRDALSATVGGIVAMIPQGLVLLTSVAFAVGVVRLARRQVVVQELPAVEILARVDVICLDKTGTITHGDLELDRIEPLTGTTDETSRDAVAALVASDPSPNATLRALGQGLARQASAETDTETDARSAKPQLPDMPAGWEPTRAVPFSSARKWSGATFGDRRTWVLGAPDVLLGHAGHDAVREEVNDLADRGVRVLLLAHTTTALPDVPATSAALPPGLEPKALALLEDRVRSDAADTLAYFASQGVTVKVISGDHPTTVAAVARRAGLHSDGAVDARTLPEEPAALGKAVDDASIFGRVTPQQKRAMVRALQANGHTVAMTGDGVNDVLALKDADIGIAMGSGSSASRAAAQLVLLSGEFSALPHVVAEGRRVINNIERVANLFLTKTIYALLLAFAIAAAVKPYPFLPRHFTLIDALTIGIPGFFLALAPKADRARPQFLRRVLRFTVPYGILAAVITFAAYLIALRGSPPLVQSRTAATLVLVGVALVVLVQLVRPVTGARAVLVAAMLGGFVLVMGVPFGRHFFALTLPAAGMLGAGAVLVAVAIAASVAISRAIDRA